MTVIDSCSFDKSFYAREYEKNNTSAFTGMSQEDNLRATSALLDYLRGSREDIVVLAKVGSQEREVFNERETRHMVDVRALYQKAVSARNIMTLLTAFLLVYLIGKEKLSIPEILRMGFREGVMIIVIFVLFVAVWALADFNAFWTNFHLLLFDNDLWLLDPNTSIMINLFPGSFFFDLVIRIILIYLALILGISLYAFFPWRKAS